MHACRASCCLRAHCIPIIPLQRRKPHPHHARSMSWAPGSTAPCQVGGLWATLDTVISRENYVALRCCTESSLCSASPSCQKILSGQAAACLSLMRYARLRAGDLL